MQLRAIRPRCPHRWHYHFAKEPADFEPCWRDFESCWREGGVEVEDWLKASIFRHSFGRRHDGVHYQARISLPVPRMLQLDLHILPKRFRRQPLYQSLRGYFGRSGMIFSVRAAM